MLTFSDDPPKVYEIPRLEDHLIDELFYQEDEIGEMRHTAFMIECGLEEDPPDGPDVPPIPWKFTPGTATVSHLTTTNGTSVVPNSPTRSKRYPPKRTSSMDDIEELESELMSSPVRREPRRKLAVTKSGTFHGISKPLPEKSHSADSIENIKVDDDDGPARRERRAAPVVRKPKMLVKAKSGSLHGLRDAARKVQEANNPDASQEETVSPRSLRRSKLVATKSGTLHGMRRAVEEENSQDPTVVRRKLVATKSGTLHGMRKDTQEMVSAAEAASKKKDASPVAPKRNGVTKAITGALNGTTSRTLINSQRDKKKKTERKPSSEISSESEDESLSRFDNSSSDLESNVSLDTDEDVPKSPLKKRDVMPKIPIKSPTRTPAKFRAGVEAKAVERDKEEDSKPRNRVFRNGKLVSDVGTTPEKCADESEVNGTPYGSVRERLRNGNASPAEVPRYGQAGKSTPKKNVSSLGIPPAFQNKTAVPSLFQPSKELAAEKTRPGKLRIPMKAKSVSTFDIPPAFRTGGVGK